MRQGIRRSGFNGSSEVSEEKVVTKVPTTIKTVVGILFLLVIFQIPHCAVLFPDTMLAAHAKFLYENKKYQSASILYKKLLEKYPESLNIRIRYGLALYYHKEYKNSLNVFRSISKKDWEEISDSYREDKNKKWKHSGVWYQSVRAVYDMQNILNIDKNKYIL